MQQIKIKHTKEMNQMISWVESQREQMKEEWQSIFELWIDQLSFSAEITT